MSTVRAGSLRVVLDTNVYVSAFTHPQGPPSQVWRQALHERYTLLISPAIVAEVARVLRLKFAWNDLRIIRRMKLLVRVAEIVSPTITLQIIKDDPSDDRILECAVSGQADLIVSGDHHLANLKSFRGIGIIRPADLLRTLGIRMPS
jgi:putative PIN family toxin of toxin-antitoxin system